MASFLPSSIYLPGPRFLFASIFNSLASSVRTTSSSNTAPAPLQNLESQNSEGASIAYYLSMVKAELEIQEFCSTMASIGTHEYYATNQESAGSFSNASLDCAAPHEQSSLPSSTVLLSYGADADSTQTLLKSAETTPVLFTANTPSVNPSALAFAQAFDATNLDLTFDPQYRAAPVIFDDPRSLRNADAFWAQANMFPDDEQDGSGQYENCSPVSLSERPDVATPTFDFVSIIQSTPDTEPTPPTMAPTASSNTVMTAMESNIVYVALVNAATTSVTTSTSANNNSTTGQNLNEISDNGDGSNASSPTGSPMYRVSYGTGLVTACSFLFNSTTFAPTTTCPAALLDATSANINIAITSPGFVSAAPTAFDTTSPIVTTADTTTGATCRDSASDPYEYGSYDPTRSIFWSQGHPAHQSFGYKRKLQTDPDDNVTTEKDNGPRVIKKSKRTVDSTAASMEPSKTCSPRERLISDATYGGIANNNRLHSQHDSFLAPASFVTARQPLAVIQDTNKTHNINYNRQSLPGSSNTTTTNVAASIPSFTHRSLGTKRKSNRDENDEPSPTSNKHSRTTQ
ncbi:hypothetical protein BG015_003221 [Linnemannia schmuckeri]|uniref:Uncharacterized protein n=1 Tax=Linnemannia schmuckeri TaxID=64567 RepID=A0A9P5V5H1_9FUNG|nr:hypothetical protein BG015_003221 [Linnemannia schmuckeri]